MNRVRVRAWIGTIIFLFVAPDVTTYEEPTLLRTYGDEYRRYTRNVRGWVPRLTPWRA